MFKDLKYFQIYNYIRFLFLALLPVFSLVSLWSLTFYPSVFIDEPWYSNAAWNYVNGGGLMDTMNKGILDRSLETQLRWPFLGSLPFVLVFKILGLGLYQGRLASWVIGLALLMTTYFFTQKFYSHTSAVIATFILAVSWPFLQASHYIRPDITLALSVLIAVFFYLTALDNERPWLFLLAGLFIGLTVDIHPNGIIFAVALSIVHITIFRKSLLQTSATWFFISGALFAILYYFGIRYDFNFRLALQLSPVEAKILTPPFATLNLKEILRGFYYEFGRLNAFDHPLDFVLIGASLFYVLGRRHKTDQFILKFLAVTYILMSLLTANKNQIYTILYYPYFAIFIAESLVETIRDKKIFSPEGMLWGGLLACSLAVITISFMRPLYDARGYNYQETTRQLNQVIPEETTVLGMPYWWLGLSNTDYRSILGITYLHILDDKSLAEALETISPQYIILDPAIRGRLVEQGYFQMGSFDAYLMPRQEFEAYLDQNAQKIFEYNAPFDGLLEVYKVITGQ